MRATITAGLAVMAMLAGTGLCAAQPYPAPGQAPPVSHYADGTGNVAVEALNAGQLDQNYRGPWHVVPANRVRHPYGAPAYAPRPYAAYVPRSSMPPGAYRQFYPQPVIVQGGY